MLFRSTIFRFPGGSHARGTDMRRFIVENGYNYVDWNCIGGDTATIAPVPVENIVSEVKRTFNSANSNSITLLLHDTSSKRTSAEALPEIISFFREMGYEFVTIPNF